MPYTPLDNRRYPNFPASEAACVREARIGDAWQIADTHCSTFMPDQGHVVGIALRLDRMISLLGSLPLQHKKYLVAVDKDNKSSGASHDMVVSGILTVDRAGEFLPRRRPSGHRRTGVAYVSNVAVRAECRRRGIAKRLLKQAEQVARDWGCRSIALHCDTCNAAATGLYRSQGYRSIPMALSAKWPQPSSKLLFMIKLLAPL